MSQDQIILFCIFVLVFGFLVWGRWRYDLVAFIALLVALVTGVVPKEQAFSGFGHPAVIIIALVLVISRGLYASGAIDLLLRLFADKARSLAGHIAVMAGLGAGLSAVMNNVAALALLMPADIQAAVKAKRSPALSLMPLSFATILGGLITLIGTPPNIIIAAYREQALGESFAMFDFAPVGLACAAVGIVFVALVGWRLIPSARGEHDTTRELFEIEGYIAELTVAKDSSAVGKVVAELDEIAEEADSVILGLVRKGKRLAGQARRTEIRAGDIIVVEAAAEGISELVGELKLEFAGRKKSKEPAGGDMALMEVVVPRDARVEGRSAMSLYLLARHGITLLGVSRRGKRFRERVRKLEIQAGDVLLLLGPNERLQDIAGWLGCLPLAARGLQLIQRDKAWLAAGIFAAAILLASFGLVPLPVALAVTVVLYVLFNVVPLRELYDAIEWPVIVLLASLIPIGGALETSGGTELIAQGIVQWTQGYSPVVVLSVLMIVTMTLSDVLNNTATAVVAAPIAVDISRALNVSPDPFLMAVAVAASCAFLTPIGHQNNTLILGPGGYRFGDYWRMGLPLEIIVIAVGVPVILWVWPLQ
jgi:di/tricarboxylate transporter